MVIQPSCLGTGLDFVVVWLNFQISLVLKLSDEDCSASYICGMVIGQGFRLDYGLKPAATRGFF
ncbi:hypothetical protein D9B38_06210 [Corynebacterium diphtheriae]|nr:hypothetical protein D9B95_06660 [Corynebacterium diphtheriae]RKW91211.1 hypothetical protein D9B38_06210 [Corynebacterium diphtheriae]RKX07255.1 hypothetical protein D9B98_06455 [Corynebacterium diphtheriae]RNF47457.1 hypothetical protein EFE11_06600 [Corynebacterium diphtheriae]